MNPEQILSHALMHLAYDLSINPDENDLDARDLLDKILVEQFDCRY